MSFSSGSQPSLNPPRKTPKLALRLQRHTQTRQLLCVTRQKVDLWQPAINKRLEMMERYSWWYQRSFHSIMGFIRPNTPCWQSRREKRTPVCPGPELIPGCSTEDTTVPWMKSGEDANCYILCSYALKQQSNQYRQYQAKEVTCWQLNVCLVDQQEDVCVCVFSHIFFS